MLVCTWEMYVHEMSMATYRQSRSAFWHSRAAAVARVVMLPLLRCFAACCRGGGCRFNSQVRCQGSLPQRRRRSVDARD